MNRPISNQLVFEYPSGDLRSFLTFDRIKIHNDPVQFNQGLYLQLPHSEPVWGWIRNLGHSLQLHIEPASSIHFEYGGAEFQSGKIPLHSTFRIGPLTGNFLPKFEHPSDPHHSPHDPQSCPWMTISKPGLQLLRKIENGARSDLSIYLHGETGTGKDVLARWIHQKSLRKNGPLISIHCAALPLSLAESELFGHLRGSFTGASSTRVGALLKANGGTLFLDEVGDLPPEIQVKLLRFLENGELKQVGSDHWVKSDVRIICATHADLPEKVKAGSFREDLYYRLASLTIKVPSLRERVEDLPVLAHGFAKNLNRLISSSAIDDFKKRPWRGNVRELKHAIERASALAPQCQQVLMPSDFEFLGSIEDVSEGTSNENGEDSNLGFRDPRKLNLWEHEKNLLLAALKATGGNRVRAAGLMGIARSTLFSMLKKYQINGPIGNQPRPKLSRSIKSNKSIDPTADQSTNPH